MKTLKKLSLLTRQIIAMFILLFCLVTGIILVLGEIEPFNLVHFILIKVLGIAFLFVAWAFIKVIIPRELINTDW